MESNYKSLQAENYALREYVINLQSRLLDVQGECPQPPPNINLAHPHGAQPPVTSSSADPHAPNQSTGAGTPLEVVAQAVAGLQRGDHLAEGPQYSNRMKPEQGEGDSRSNEDISRQLQPDPLPSAMM